MPHYGSQKLDDRGLNEKQRAFIREYAIHKNATQAAINAGYSRHTAHVQGSRLLTHVKVQQALEQQESAHAAQCGITVETITQMLTEDRALARSLKQSAAAVSATLGLAKVHGLIEDKQRLSGAIGNYERTPIPTSDRDPVPAVDSPAGSANGSHPPASRH